MTAPTDTRRSTELREHPVPCMWPHCPNEVWTVHLECDTHRAMELRRRADDLAARLSTRIPPYVTQEVPR